MRIESRDVAIALSPLGLAVLFWRLRIVAPAKEILMWWGGDLYAQIYPMAYRAAGWIRGDQVPLWNPHQSCGHPFCAAVLYGVFYPLFRAVPVGPGTHHVVFEYDAASFAIGRGVTLAALAVVAGVPLLALYRRRTRVGTLTAV